MTGMTLAHSNGNGNGNGSTPSNPSWMLQSARKFFSAINWDDNSPEIQEIKLTAFDNDSTSPLSLVLKVGQFFNAVNWDGMAIAVTPSFLETLLDEPANSTQSELTLDDFSDLF